MSDTEMSASILDCNGLLVTEQANKEPDQKVEDELLQSASEDEDKDNQAPTPLNELAYKRTKKSEQKSSRKRPYVKQTRDSHIRGNPAKRARHTMNSVEAIKKRMKTSEEAILKLETHRQKQTCPKTLRYDAKAKIRADEEFKEEIKTIRKQAEQRLLGALIKFHHKSIDSNKRHLNKVSHKERLTKANKKAVNRSEHENNLDFELDKAPDTNVLKQQVQNIQQQFKLMQEMMSNLKKASNKDVSAYPGVLTESFNGKQRISNTRKYLTNKGKHRKKLAKKSITKRDEEIKSTFTRNLSNCNLTTDEINLLSKGLLFIPSPHTTTDSVKKQILRDFNQFARRMRLRYIYRGRGKMKHPFYVKSNWEPPVQSCS